MILNFIFIFFMPTLYNIKINEEFVCAQWLKDGEVEKSRIISEFTIQQGNPRHI